MREQSRQDQVLATSKGGLKLVEGGVGLNFQDEGHVGAVEGEAFTLDSFLLLAVLSLEVIEAEDLGVLLGQVLIWVPVAVLERTDTSVLLETLPGVLEGSVHLIGEVHVIAVTILQLRMFLMLLGHSLVVNKVLVFVFFVVALFVVAVVDRVVVVALATHHGNLHVIHHVYDVVLLVKLGERTVEGGRVHLGSALHVFVDVHAASSLLVIFHGVHQLFFRDIGLLGSEGVGNLLDLVVIDLLSLFQLVDNLSSLGSGHSLLGRQARLFVGHVKRTLSGSLLTRSSGSVPAANDTLGPRGTHDSILLALTQLHRAGVVRDFNLLDLEGQLVLDSCDMEKALGVQEIVADVAAHLNFLLRAVHLS
mmetsp:Transcript_35871/g.55048  ORF Transcript_35871/g.55048 Transcript_35871/m.55048 type:complete len:363 (+) Transcript_35871:652-1740(+)